MGEKAGLGSGAGWGRVGLGGRVFVCCPCCFFVVVGDEGGLCCE